MTIPIYNPVESCTYANDFFFFLHVLDTGFSAAYILSATGYTWLQIYGSVGKILIRKSMRNGAKYVMQKENAV